jgi:AAA domain
MLIELFGAPAAGKTMFAQDLATRLRRQGNAVHVVLSSRPAEVDDTAAQSPFLAAIHRLTRPVVERLAAGGANTNLSSALLGILPARSLTWSTRLRQYTIRLEASWRAARRFPGIVIIDQGFVQLVCSLVLLGQTPERSMTAIALETIPHADLLIRLSAPPEVLRERLDARRQGQGWLERCLELDIETNLRSVGIVETLEEILRQQGHPVLGVECQAAGASPEALERIAGRFVRVPAAAM